MTETLIYYVSGHGFGHARRSAEIIRFLLRRRPALNVQIRTAAPHRLFEPIPERQIRQSDIDAGMSEIDALTIDIPDSLCRLEQLIARRESIVSAESKSIGGTGARLIVCDAPFLAGDVADRVGVPCVLASNFTWDWIYEPLFAHSPNYANRWAPLREVIRAGYAKMAIALRLPFGELSDALPKVVPVPLVATRSALSTERTLQLSGLPQSDTRPRVLLSVRGGLSEAAVAKAAADARDFQFLLPNAGGAFTGGWPQNVRPVTFDRELGFSDVLSISKVVMSKLGYGTVSECIAAGVRLLWPGRIGFREDDVVSHELPRYVASAEIPREDFAAGDWARHLRRCMALPPAGETMPSDGAEVCAGIIDRLLDCGSL